MREGVIVALPEPCPLCGRSSTSEAVTLEDRPALPPEEVALGKGWKTSEFWMALTGKIFGLLALFGIHPALPVAVSGVVSAVGGILATGATVAYSLSRGKVKAAELGAGGLVAAPAQITPIVKATVAATIAEMDAKLMDLPLGLGGIGKPPPK